MVELEKFLLQSELTYLGKRSPDDKNNLSNDQRDIGPISYSIHMLLE